MTASVSPAEPLHAGALAAGKLDVAGYLQRWLERTRGQEIGLHDLLDGRRVVRDVQVAQRYHAA